MSADKPLEIQNHRPRRGDATLSLAGFALAGFLTFFGVLDVAISLADPIAWSGPTLYFVQVRLKCGISKVSHSLTGVTYLIL